MSLLSRWATICKVLGLPLPQNCDDTVLSHEKTRVILGLIPEMAGTFCEALDGYKQQWACKLPKRDHLLLLAARGRSIELFEPRGQTSYALGPNWGEVFRQRRWGWQLVLSAGHRDSWIVADRRYPTKISGVVRICSRGKTPEKASLDVSGETSSCADLVGRQMAQVGAERRAEEQKGALANWGKVSELGRLWNHLWDERNELLGIKGADGE